MYRLINMMGSTTSMEQMINTFAGEGMEVVTAAMEGGRFVVLFKTTDELAPKKIAKNKAEAMEAMLAQIWRDRQDGHDLNEDALRECLVETCGIPRNLLHRGK